MTSVFINFWWSQDQSVLLTKEVFHIRIAFSGKFPAYIIVVRILDKSTALCKDPVRVVSLT